MTVLLIQLFLDVANREIVLAYWWQHSCVMAFNDVFIQMRRALEKTWNLVKQLLAYIDFVRNRRGHLFEPSR